MKSEVISKRLKEAFGKDTQETVAAKLHMSQANVSKILSGRQMPTAEMLESVSNIYEVSVDWLLGLSDDKHVHKVINAPTYEEAVKILLDAEACGAIKLLIESNGNIEIKVEDPLLQILLKKGNGLRKIDFDIYKDWREQRLSEFDGKEIINSDVWDDDLDLIFYLKEAGNENNLVEVYERALKEQKEYVRIVGPDPGPFDQ